MLKIVLDTNVLLVSISDKSAYHWLYKALTNKDFELFITNEILTEYEEVIPNKWHPAVADSVVRTLLQLSNVNWMEVFFKFNLIHNDPDDDKFVDCAFASNADYIVTNDRHFNVLKAVDFPKIKTVSLLEFKTVLGK